MVQGTALLISEPGTRFGQIELGEENHLSEDTDAGTNDADVAFC